jgi:hypothetical protein
MKTIWYLVKFFSEEQHMTAIYTDGFECIDGKIEYAEDEGSQLKEATQN